MVLDLQLDRGLRDRVAGTALLDEAVPSPRPSSWLLAPQLEAAACVPEEGTGAYDQLRRYGVGPLRQERIPRAYFRIDAAERDARIWDLRRRLGDRLVVLGHHYQRDEVIQFADFRGDSFKLSQQAAGRPDAEFILFCGVHFMAESADILSGPNQTVILPNLEAGCSMADMAKADDVQAAWDALGDLGISGLVPITYMNSAAALKAFCGRHGGIVCTSSNAGRVFDWAFERGEKLFFFPDEHLGRNTGVKKGIPTDKMVVWDPFLPLGGNTAEALRDAVVILWKGYCSVHARFSVEQIEVARAAHPGVNVIVHPECRLEVVQAADCDGSTEFIIDTIRAAAPGTTWAVGTEINLVRRLDAELPDKHVFCLDPVICPCSTMYRVHPAYVLWTLEHLASGQTVNQIRVEPEIARDALVALDRMLSVP
ncbi:MAG: Quinolinate synthetase [uncultured Thermomicrobiales bacterium]|uniref:Quinolinate synthase n=1 Tax=uncultured Thermomicrobiales bacterium TaxID=1645740 RepID=A0A6J4TZT1_9BACT|nr:MAG: Quinolinate synthetase [uncultured Thermomicrobiales bacterium]